MLRLSWLKRSNFVFNTMILASESLYRADLDAFFWLWTTMRRVHCRPQYPGRQCGNFNDVREFFLSCLVPALSQCPINCSSSTSRSWLRGNDPKLPASTIKLKTPNHTPDKYQTSISSPAKPPPAFPKSIQIKKFFSKLIEIMSQVLYTDSSVIYRY